MFSKTVISICILCVGFIVSPAVGQDSKIPYQDNMLSALFSPVVLRDLELVDDQKSEIESILKDVKTYRTDLISELKEYTKSGATPEEVENRKKEAQSQIDQKKAECLKMVSETLLPHQMDRLRQSTAQVMMKEFAKHQKVESGLLTSQMKDYLEIDKDQEKEIREKAKKLREELAAEIKKLNDEATEKLMKTLTTKQRKKYQELVGDKLEGGR